MEKTHRITYRFDRNGNKIDEHVEVERLEQLIRSMDNEHKPLEEQSEAAVSVESKTAAGKNGAAAGNEREAAAGQAGWYEQEQQQEELLLKQRYELDIEDERQSTAAAMKPPVHSGHAGAEGVQAGAGNIGHKKVEAASKASHLHVQEGGKSAESSWLDSKGQATELNEQQEHKRAMEWWEQEEQYKPRAAKRKQQEETREYAVQLEEETQQTEQGWVWQDRSSAAEAAASAVTRKSTRQGFTWAQGAISVISAIISGGVIGYLLLTLVFGVDVWPMSALAQPKQPSVNIEGTANDEVLTLPGNKDAADPQASSEAGQSQSDGEGVSLQLGEQAFQYYVLQAGVFTKENTRDEVISSLQQAGFAAQFTTDSNNRYFVYAGLATTTVDADSMQGKIKGIETYRKPLTIALPHAMAFNGEVEKLEQYFKQSNELIAMYADLVAVQLEQASYSKIGNAAAASWQTSYEQWQATAEATSELWSTQRDREQAGQLQEQLAEAQQQLEQYQKQPKSIYLWKVQSALMKSVLVQKDWFEQVNTLS